MKELQLFVANYKKTREKQSFKPIPQSETLTLQWFSITFVQQKKREKQKKNGFKFYVYFGKVNKMYIDTLPHSTIFLYLHPVDGN